MLFHRTRVENYDLGASTLIVAFSIAFMLGARDRFVLDLTAEYLHTIALLQPQKWLAIEPIGPACIHSCRCTKFNLVIIVRIDNREYCN